MRLRDTWWLASAVILFAGCGGGGGGGTTTVQTPTTPSVTAWPTASAITYGQTLASSTLTGGTASVSGTFAWTTATTAPGAGTPSESVTFTPTNTAAYTTVMGTVTVTVNRATPTVTTWPAPSAIAYGQTLASSTLTGGTASVTGTFAWTTPTTAPGTGTDSESVTFTPSDSTDLNAVTGSVSVTVGAAIPTVSTWPVASTITYGQTLASSTLTGGTASVAGTFAWTTPTAAPSAGTLSESVTFTPADTTDYVAVVGTVAVTVSKATPTVSAWPTASPITYGQTLASSTLTGGTASVSGAFAWTTPSTEPSVGTDSESVTFTPTDATDYNTVSGSISVTVTAITVTVDFGTTYQTIRGFGGSTAWLGQMPTAVATALFSPTSGLGLNILRVRIDPEGSSTGGGAHGDPYETGEWDYEAANGKEAVAANPDAIVFATPWTAPAVWKLSGSSSFSDDGETWNQSFNTCAEGTGYCGGYLNSADYANYAGYLEDFVKFFNTTNGFDLYAISMQNEPEENVTYESCVWTPEEMDAWVAGNASTITSDAYSTKLIMPESDVFNPIDAETTLNDSNAEGLVSIIGGHIYQVLGGGSIVPYTIPSGDTSKELWMTEFGPLSTATPTWATALTTYAESIHNSMVTGQYNAYVWWGLFGSSTGSGATAAGTWGLVDNGGTPTVMGYAVGQYSKFIQRGFVRVSATANPTSGVYVSAYDYPPGNSAIDNYAIVAINANTSSETLSFTLSNGNVTSVTPYQSTSSAGLAAQSAVAVSSGQFTYTLPAQSIVTFVQ